MLDRPSSHYYELEKRKKEETKQKMEHEIEKMMKEKAEEPTVSVVQSIFGGQT